MDVYERTAGRGYEGGREMRGMDDGARGRTDITPNQRGRWGPTERRGQPEEYPSKRRRY